MLHVERPDVSIYLPAGHLTHVVPDDDPFTTEYLPALQAIQSANSSLPDVSTYLPAGHLSHVVPEAPTAVEYVPSPQFVQAADPVDVLYFPATHAAHGPPFGPVDPVLQVQFVKAALPGGEVELV